MTDSPTTTFDRLRELQADCGPDKRHLGLDSEGLEHGPATEMQTKRLGIAMPNRSTTDPIANTLICGKPLQQWDAEWVPVAGGFTKLHSDLCHVVGLFRAVLSGEVMYIGKGTEFTNGGLRKRLADFRRKSPSARGHGELSRSGNTSRISRLKYCRSVRTGPLPTPRISSNRRCSIGKARPGISRSGPR